MEFSQTSSRFPVVWVASTASTNDYARDFATSWEAPEGLFLVATHTQTGGHGRRGRQWVAPAASALALTIVLPAWRYAYVPTWAPLLAGCAVAEIIGELLEGFVELGGSASRAVSVKWPNDVLLTVSGMPWEGARAVSEAAPGEVSGAASGTEESGTDAPDNDAQGNEASGTDAPESDAPGTDAQPKKLAGILTEQLPSGRVLVGIGVNLTQKAEQLAPFNAVSLRSAGLIELDGLENETGEALLDALTNAITTRFLELLELDAAAGRARVENTLGTLGQEIRAEFADGSQRRGTAIGLGKGGELIVCSKDGVEYPITAADVHHLRPIAE